MGKIEKLWDEFAELKKQEDKEYEIIQSSLELCRLHHISHAKLGKPH